MATFLRATTPSGEYFIPVTNIAYVKRYPAYDLVVLRQTMNKVAVIRVTESKERLALGALLMS